MQELKNEEEYKKHMIQVLTPDKWRDYELLDSGNERKLERFGQYIVIRPDPRAIWKPLLREDEWKIAEASFTQDEETESWHFQNDPPTPWEISYEKLKFSLRTTNFKHLGVFPEQAVNWEWLKQVISNELLVHSLKPKILNLFAYTGGATEACTLAGAHVTHVDSSRPSMMWASDNMKLARVNRESVRWIQDDAIKFVQREIRRKAFYEGIIMDPPRFGRGANGEVWKLLEDLPRLVDLSQQLLSENPLFFLINAYTADISSLALQNMISGIPRFKSGMIESGELGLRESSGRILPAGIFARWSNNTKA